MLTSKDLSVNVASVEPLSGILMAVLCKVTDEGKA